MKKIFTLCVAFFATIATFAQQPMATLDHNDTITVYYGNQALKSAYNAAVPGDIITLSSGEFDGNSLYLEKNNLTIRGAGMRYDSITRTNATTVSSSPYIRGGAHDCTFEGIYFDYQLYLESSSNNRFNKCKFKQIYGYSSYALMYSFYSCIINKISINSGIIRNSNFYNCILVTTSSTGNNNNCQVINYSGNALSNNWNNRIYNSVVQIGGNSSISSENAEYYNCILFSYNGSSTVNPVSHSCIGISVNGNFWGGNSQNLVNRTFANTFVNYTGGGYSDSQDFSLTPEAQAVLGLDSTQLGIYGGAHPFNPHVDEVPPIIGRVTVPNHSNAEGRLDVNVEIITDEE